MPGHGLFAFFSFTHAMPSALAPKLQRWSPQSGQAEFKKLPGSTSSAMTPVRKSSLSSNWFAVNKPGDMRSAVTQEFVGAAGWAIQHPTHLLGVFDGHLFENTVPDMAKIETARRTA
jgi:hypothetical protein